MNIGISKVVDLIFLKYDRNGTGSLNADDLGMFLSDVFKMIGIPITVSSWQTSLLMKILDKNKNGMIEK
jgi:Ca2+-binding EF-hand superfamily protein